MRTLLLILFLISSALLAVTLFAKKLTPIKDAKNYTELNPNCREIKIHSQKNDIVECFLNFELNFERSFPIIKLLAERHPKEFPLRMRYIYSIADNLTDSMQISGNSLHLVKNKNSVWHDKNTGCDFLGDCFAEPFRDSSVYAVLPGKVLKAEENSLLLYHGKNIYSKIYNIEYLKELKKGDIISPDSSLGFPTEKTFVEVIKDGRRVLE